MTGESYVQSAEIARSMGPAHPSGRAIIRRWDRPIGIWLLLWPTLWALWISGRGKPNPRIFIIFVVGTVLMRSAGCAINDDTSSKAQHYSTHARFF